MKNLFLPILFLIFSQLSMAQQMPIDFSDTEENFTGFSGSMFAIVNDPNDASNEVGQFFNDGTTAIQGFFLDLDRAIDLDFQKTISLSFYTFDPNAHTITLKLENGLNPDVEVTQNTSSTGWTNDIVFDFANASLSADGTSVNASGTYNRIVLFIDLATATPGTYLIDDIDDGSMETNLNELDVIYDYLVWSDEFDTEGPIDGSKWFPQTQLPAGMGGWFNGELQHYTNRLENAFIEDGFLNIVAKRENFTDQGETKQFTSARLNAKFAFTYGRVDVRAKLPRGEGTWPAIWTLGKNINEDGAWWDNQGFGTTPWPACGEIDIMEHGLGAVNHVSSALHTPSSFGNTINTDSKEISDVADNFHVYSVNWSPNQITFLIDGEGYYTYNPPVKDANTWPFDLEQYLILNVAMGGFAGSIDPSFTESPMVIDYIRIYQTNPVSTTGIEGDHSISVFPNPTSDKVTISSTGAPIDQIILYDTSGKEILRKQLNQTNGQLDLSRLPKGTYILRVAIGEQQSEHKIKLK